MTYMTDTGRAATFLNFAFAGGSIMTVTTPYMLRLLTAQGSGNGNVNGSNGTQLTGTGYTAGGNSMGSSPTFAAFGTGTATSTGNSNAVSWSVGSSWSAITAIEIWDSAGTPLRWLQGALSASITGAASGDTVQFAASSIVPNASAW
jgi:hypothetical protein